jgi:uncharacterized protein (TIGR03086 family)
VSTERLEQVFTITRGIVANIKPEQLDSSTPCASWDVRRLLNHVVGGSHWFAMSTNAGASPDVDTTEDTDYTQGDYLASYDEGIKASLAAFGAPGALEKTVKLPFGEFPGAAFMGLATADHFTHGWDLARATGQDSNLDPELAEQILAQCRATIPEQFRGADGVMPFGPVVDVPDSAPAADRLAGFLGRTP